MGNKSPDDVGIKKYEAKITEEVEDLRWEYKLVKLWNHDDVLKWLGHINFQKHFKKHEIHIKKLSGCDLSEENLPINIKEFKPYFKNLYHAFLFFCNLHIVQKCIKEDTIYPLSFYPVNLKLFHKRILSQRVLKDDNLDDWKIHSFSKMSLFLSQEELFRKQFLLCDLKEIDGETSIPSPLREIVTLGETVDVKLVVNENTSTFEKTILKVFSPIVNMILPQDFGLFHLALIIGPWYLDWTDTALVIPRSHTSGTALLVIDIGQLPAGNIEEQSKIKHILSKSIVEWNTIYQYANYPSKKRKFGNSHAFTMDLLEKLEIKVQLEKDGALKTFLQDMSFWGTFKLSFRPSDGFTEEFKLLENTAYKEKFYKKNSFVIKFETHRELDEFVYYCYDTNEKVVKKFDEEFTLLKSFDKAFWLRFGKSPSKKEYKPHPFTEKRVLGCPFSDSSDSQFWAHFFSDNKVSKLSDEEIEGEEETKKKKKIKEELGEGELLDEEDVIIQNEDIEEKENKEIEVMEKSEQQQSKEVVETIEEVSENNVLINEIDEKIDSNETIARLEVVVIPVNEQKNPRIFSVHPLEEPEKRRDVKKEDDDEDEGEDEDDLYGTSKPMEKKVTDLLARRRIERLKIEEEWLRDLVKGKKFVDYTLIKRLGRRPNSENKLIQYDGNCSLVFLCCLKQDDCEETFVMKIPHNLNPFIKNTPQVYRTFVPQEIVKNLPFHPNIVNCLHKFVDNVSYDDLPISKDEISISDFTPKTAIFIMKHYSRNLKKYLLERNHDLENLEVLVKLEQLLDAICHLHENKISHRDLKPDNVFLDQSGNVLIGDFGKHLNCRTTGFNFSIDPLYFGMFDKGGAPYFLCPEVRTCDLSGDEPMLIDFSKNDVFSVGLIGCYMIQKEDVYKMGKGMKDGDLFLGIKNEKIDKRIIGLLSKMTSLDPKSRIGCHEGRKICSKLLFEMILESQEKINM